ncbi:MAG: DUF4340 domain-containing protein [Planctomycetota bacterium]|jgi:hypothetical protein
MSDRKLMILGVVAGLMVVLAVGQSYLSKMTSEQKPGGGGYLIQGLETAKISVIEVGKGDNPVRLVRQGNRFVVGTKEDYPAVTSKINSLLTSCLDIRTTMDPITSNPANHESLGVTKDKAQNVVKFLDGTGQLITGVVIGTSRLPDLDMSKRSTYVRLISSDDVYEAVEVPLPGASAMDYIEKEIVNVDRGDVVRVTVTGPEGSYTLRVDDSNGDNIVLEDLPAGKNIKKSDCEQVMGALSYVSFDDVKKESSLGDVKPTFDSTYISELKDATVYTFEIAKAESKTYIKCRAEYTGDTSNILESKEAIEEKEAKLLAHDRADDFNKRHQGWVYELADWTAKKLTRKVEELYEEEKKEEKADEPAALGGGEEAKGEPAE